MSGNQYEDVLLETDPYTSLKLLQLTSNCLNDWSSVVKIDKVFPNLKYLTLADNSISQCGELSSLVINACPPLKFQCGPLTNSSCMLMQCDCVDRLL